MRVIAVANQKGGCGKTTTAINLSSSLASRGWQVLLIDFDPQAHATMGLGIKPADLEKSVYNVIKPGTNQAIDLDDIVIPIRDNFDLAPSNAILSAIEQELAGVEGRESRLMQAIGTLKKPYETVIVDCPPSIGHLCFNALRASEEVIIPIDLSLFSLRGVSKLMEIVLLLKEELGHEINARALITMYDFRTRYSRHVLEKVRERFGEKVFDTAIRYNIRLRETVDYGMPIGEYDKHSIGHKDYEKLADEFTSSWEASTAPGFDALDAARNFQKLSEEYAALPVETSERPQDLQGGEEISSGAHCS
jgi:chromosome partitioning protein